MNRMTTKGQKVGYIRVSSIEQNTESQKSLLGNVGMDKVFEEKLKRKEYRTSTATNDVRLC